MAWFKVIRRVVGPGYQVRVRDAGGSEETTDILPDIEEACRVFDHLQGEGLIPLSARPA